MATKVTTPKRAFEILLVEDNLGDVLLMKEILKLSTFRIHLSVARDGEEALEMLTHDPRFGERKEPDIILLDLNLPKLDGRELLTRLKEDPDLKHIPILIMTSSHDDADMTSSYQNHANFYIVKPMDLDHFAVIVKYIEEFWLKNIQ